MHFSIPDTQEINDDNGSTFKGYNVHINGVFHCTVRFKQLHNLHEQLRKEYGASTLPPFPPKKLLPLTASQLEERRALLEKYIQSIGQDPRLVTSELLNGFLLSAQQETNCEKRQEMTLDVFIMNGYQISLNVFTTDKSEQVLIKACKQINLPQEYVHYFSLFLLKKEENGDITVFRKLQDFESPYISHKSIQEQNKVVLRKSYWDPEYDIELMSNPVAMNLLYVQTVSDVERGWILCSTEMQSQLTSLQARGAKREYVELARTLKYYGFLQFKPCLCDYPKSQSLVLVSIGNQELNLRVNMGPGQEMREGSFKVTRMRCWRITALHNNKYNATSSNNKHSHSELELSFEYLMSKDKLQWITISSDQAILMSVCLQSMVDELLLKKNGLKKKQSDCGNRNSWSYMKRDGSSQLISPSQSPVTDGHAVSNNGDNSGVFYGDALSIRKLQEKFSSVSFKTGKEFVENHAFEGIGDDDL